MLFLSICLVCAKCKDETVQQSDKRQCRCKVEAFLFFVACRCCVTNQSRTPRNNMADLLSDEEMGKLIDLYQEEENLYNYRIREYRDRDKAVNLFWGYTGQWGRTGTKTQPVQNSKASEAHMQEPAERILKAERVGLRLIWERKRKVGVGMIGLMFSFDPILRQE